MFGTIISALLAYMDKPWKLVGIIALLIIGLLVYMVYETRSDIARLILHQRPRLQIEVFVKEAPSLLRATNADVTQLVRVRLEDNLAEPLAGFTRHGAIWMPNPLTRPLVYERSDPKVVLNVIAGSAMCSDIPPDSPLLRVEYAMGVRYICLIGVPPYSGVTIGLLYVAWKTAPTSEIEYHAKLALQTLSRRISVGG